MNMEQLRNEVQNTEETRRKTCSIATSSTIHLKVNHPCLNQRLCDKKLESNFQGNDTALLENMIRK
jgi:hypothetical protein